MSEHESAGKSLVSVDFEIFGHVQGVCFRMYTEKEGLRLGLVGWVKNTYSGTVVGQVQGPSDMVAEMTTEPQQEPPRGQESVSVASFHTSSLRLHPSARTRELLFAGDVIGCERDSHDIIASRDNALVSQLRKVWLSKEGSPSCRITRASFANQRAIEKLELSGFRTRF